MKSILIFFVLIATSTNTLLSQLRLGLKTNYSISTSKSVDTYLADDRNQLAYNLGFDSENNCTSFGLSAYSDIGNLFFMTDVLYKKCELNYTLIDYRDNQRLETNLMETYQSFQVPISAGIRFGPIRLGVGPIFNFAMGADKKLKDYDGFQEKGQKIGLGAQYFVGVIIKNHVYIDFKYENSYSNVADNYHYRNESKTLRMSPNQMTVSFGFFL